MLKKEPSSRLVGLGEAVPPPLPPHLRERLFFTPCSLTLQPETTLQEWLVCGQVLGKVAGRVHWWVGDWINFGRVKWAHTPRYQEAVQLTGFEYGTLRNSAQVAAAIEVARRRHTLSFSHHAEVVSFPVELQEWLLDQAEAKSWTRAQLRREKKKLCHEG